MHLYRLAPSRQPQSPTYTEYYKRALKIEIVGIACTNFLHNLCPNYFPSNGARIPLVTRLKKHSNGLFQALQAGMQVEAFFLNPYCEFARQRDEEELYNRRCRRDVLDGIGAIESLHKALKEPRNAEARNIKGKVSVYLLKCNPYVAYTKIIPENGPEIVLVGFLLRPQRGDQCPKLLIRKPEVFRDFEQNFQDLKGPETTDLLFEWGGQKPPVFYGDSYTQHSRYDTFICYNHRDQKVAKKIDAKLRANGLLPWLDKRAIMPGAKWQEVIEEGVKKCRSISVLFGSSGLGRWQQAEVFAFLQRRLREDVKIIPVILPGVKGLPPLDALLNVYQWVDLRQRDETNFFRFCDAIREAAQTWTR
ncbi:MAG TPA: toll/interleukin-1 receptor domain-containing protein [Tepidisphaeraceae bacterium]|nr:toll/interleukin-1 receptor domain-containing protein [Tepidisphaeraceae bacterium]